MADPVSLMVGLVHATPLARGPASKALYQALPHAKQWHLLDERLLVDLEQAGVLTDRLAARFARLVAYLADFGADGILVTCSSYASVVEGLADISVPVVTPDGGMYRTVVRSHPRCVLLVVSTEAAVEPARARLRTLSRDTINVEHVLVSPNAVHAEAGAAEAAEELAAYVTEAMPDGVEVVVLAQYSLAFMQAALLSRCGLPVYSGTESAVAELAGLLSKNGSCHGR